MNQGHTVDPGLPMIIGFPWQTHLRIIICMELLLSTQNLCKLGASHC